MSRYRRNRIGHVFFFTVVTDQRRPILTSRLGRRALRTAISSTRQTLPFEITAIVLLPDHPGDAARRCGLFRSLATHQNSIHENMAEKRRDSLPTFSEPPQAW